jgi:hypothetical protein
MASISAAINSSKRTGKQVSLLLHIHYTERGRRLPLAANPFVANDVFKNMASAPVAKQEMDNETEAQQHCEPRNGALVKIPLTSNQTGRAGAPLSL